ncbi:MAG: BsuPI-related putative proteinase inhibitor [Armatimonadota bacterium]
MQDPVAGLTGTVKLDRKAARIGDTVAVEFVVRNPTRQPIRVRFSSGKRFDIEISRRPEPNARYAKGALVLWQLSRGMAFTMALGEETWKPGESRTFTARWKVPAGTPTCDAEVKATLTPIGAPEALPTFADLRLGG